MVLAQQHMVDKIHLPRVRLVQGSVIQNRYPGIQTHLRFHLKPKCIVFRLKPMQQTAIRIMRGLTGTNRIGPLCFHRRRIHRGGYQEVDEVFSGNFSFVHSRQR